MLVVGIRKEWLGLVGDYLRNDFRLLHTLVCILI